MRFMRIRHIVAVGVLGLSGIGFLAATPSQAAPPTYGSCHQTVVVVVGTDGIDVRPSTRPLVCYY